MNSKENHKSKESFENMDLTTALSNLNNNMNQGFTGMKKEIAGMKDEIKKEITGMKDEIKKEITGMKDEIIDMKNKINNNLEIISKSIDNLTKSIYSQNYGLFVLIFAICFYSLFLKKNK